MQEKRYLAMLAVGCGGFLFFFLVLSARMEAFSGSATRLGGFLECEFGWNQPQQYFEKPLFKRLASLDDYVEAVDVVVIGDSFSEDRKKSWVNYLAHAHGLSAIFFHIDEIAIGELLNHAVFRAFPPDYLFYTSNEGLSFVRFARLASLPATAVSRRWDNERTGSGAESMEQRQLAIAGHTVAYHREKAMGFQQRMAATGDFINKTVRRAVFGEGSVDVKVVAIECRSCFSNARQGNFLVMTSTIDPLAYDTGFTQAGIAGLEKLKKLVESNGHTKFFSTIFPSKINAYLPYVALRHDPTMIDPRLIVSDTGFIDLLPGLREAIADGLTDVYLPNDHHTGSSGYALAADIIAAAVGLSGSHHPEIIPGTR